MFLVLALMGATLFACRFEPAEPHIVECAEYFGGRIALSSLPNTAELNTTHKLLVLPKKNVYVYIYPEAGYELVEGSLKFNDTELNTPFFAMPNGDVTVYAEFQKIAYFMNTPRAVTVWRDGVQIDDTDAVYIGDVLDIAYSLNEGFELVSIRVNGADLEGNTFTVGAGNVNISLNVTRTAYSLTIPEGVRVMRYGQRLNSKDKVYIGDKLTIEYIRTDYYLESLKVNGEPIEDGTYTVGAENVVITVVASPLP